MEDITLNETLLDEKLEELEKARPWSPRVISKLEALIRTPENFQLFRINPIQFATDRHILEEEGIDLFLYGAKLGIFKMDWYLLCPQCGDAVQSFSTLKHLVSHYHCHL